MPTFQERLARLILERGWTQLEAAKKLGVSQALISHYLSGRREPLPRTISHIAERLGVSAGELTGKGEAATAMGKGLSGASSVAKLTDERMSAALKSLKKRWGRSQRERAAMSHLIAALFTDDADKVIAWLENRTHSAPKNKPAGHGSRTNTA